VDSSPNLGYSVGARWSSAFFRGEQQGFYHWPLAKNKHGSLVSAQFRNEYHLSKGKMFSPLIAFQQTEYGSTPYMCAGLTSESIKLNKHFVSQ